MILGLLLLWKNRHIGAMTECSILTSQAIHVTVGEPLHLQCWSNCSLPVDPIVQKKENTVIY